MMSTISFVADSDEFATLRERATEIFRVDMRLPEQVFTDDFNDFFFLEFDVLLFREFWDVLAGCAQTCGDKEVSLIVHDPDPETYYFANFQRYGALRFERNATADDYKKSFLAEPADSPADALQYVASVVSWCGSSRQWGFWGERDLGVAIAGTRNRNIQWPQVAGVSWFDLNSALDNLIAPNFENEKIPREFAAKLRHNFSRIG